MGAELLSIRQADAVMCTDWGERTFDIRSLGECGYQAPLVSTHPFFSDGGYPALEAETDRRGCSAAGE